MADNAQFARAVISLLSSVTVLAAPAGVALNGARTKTFTATVPGASNPPIARTLSSPIGSVTNAAVYKQALAQSAANPAESGSVPVALRPPRVTVSVSPAIVSLAASETQNFSATVSGIAGSGVTWSLSPAVGTISSSGLYTAPNSIPAGQTILLKAASVAGPAIFGTASIVLVSPVSVSVAPATATLQPSQTVTLDAAVSGATNTGVSWSLNPAVGGYAAGSTTAVYAAPSTISGTQNVTITATSMADPAKSASALVTLVQLAAISVSPQSVTLTPGSTQQFTAAVTGTSNTAVTWSLSPPLGTISAAGLYTAPAAVASPASATLMATSAADTTKAASATIALIPATTLTLATFQMSEPFGVAWPDQPIEFRYDGGQPNRSITRMIGPLGTEVPYQWVSSCSDTTAKKGCILVRSSLPAYATYTWTLQLGAAPTATPANPVSLGTVGNNYQITNGLTGVRIVTAAANRSPSNLAPIQGIQLASGTWTGVGASPNYLYSQSRSWEGNVGEPMQTRMYSVTGYSVQVLDSGPLKTVVQASYTFNKPKYFYASWNLPAGSGHYTARITMYANSKSVLVDEDTDMEMAYFLPLYAQLSPDIARWKGHGSSSPLCGYDAPLSVSGATNTSPIVITASSGLPNNGEQVLIAGAGGNTAANGTYYAQQSGYPAGQFALYSDPSLTTPVAGNGIYTTGGTVKPAYQGWSEADPAYDAFQDLTYTSDMPASYSCVPGSAHRRLLTDYPAAEDDGGWYYEFYQSTGGSGAPVVGMFSGDFSLDWYSATGPSMPGAYTSNAHFITGARAAGMEVDVWLRGANASTVGADHNYSVHRNWGIFVSTQADLLAPTVHQPIQDEQNTLTGINLSRLYTYQLSYPDPSGGWQWQYLPASSAAQIVSWVRNGTPVCGSVTCYYNLLSNSQPQARPILDMWQGNSTGAVQTALNTGIALAQKVEQILASGDNHFEEALGYYQLGLYTVPETAILNAVLMDNNATAAQKATAKAALGLFGSLFWDNNWFPIDNNTGSSVGLSNQIQQYLQYRTDAAAAAPSNPYLGSKLPVAVTYPVNDLNTYFSGTGAAAGSTHYQGAFFEPLILNYLNLSQDGVLSMTDPKWAAYANWELSIQTPPEPRFGNLRKGYSNGDGNTEADVRPGLLGTALQSVNPTLAGNLMWAWQQNNSASQLTEAAFISMLAIDPTIPAIAPQLGSLNFPGYHSAERYGFGTPHETSVWFINGGFYSTGGHRHYDDGQVSIYAHSAPLAIDWNANLYNPETPGRFMHDSIVYDSELSKLWSADNASLTDASTLMNNPTNTEFESFTSSTHSVATFTAADGTVWTRTVRMMNFDASYPAIYVTDSFSGPSASAAKTMTWNLMATGAVMTPAGSVTPATRFSAGCQSPAGQFPSNGTVYSLSSGLQQFHFTGGVWPAHATGGINWDLYLSPSAGSSQQFMLGNWGHGCHPSNEMNEYLSANGAPFAETQHILRVHGTGSFTTLILPYRKTEPPARTITQQSCGIQITQGSESTCFNGSVATYTSGTESVLSVYDGSSETAFGVTASGGPQEVVIQPGRIVWTISGTSPGTRSLTLSGTWHASPAVPQSGSTFTYTWAGGAQATPMTIVLAQ